MPFFARWYPKKTTLCWSLPSSLFGVLLAYYNQTVSIRKPGASPWPFAHRSIDSTTGKTQQIVNFLHQSCLSTSEHKGRRRRLMCPSRALTYLWGSLTMGWFLFCFIRKVEYVDWCPSLGLFLKGMHCWSDLFLAFPLCELQGNSSSWNMRNSVVRTKHAWCCLIPWAPGPSWGSLGVQWATGGKCIYQVRCGRAIPRLLHWCSHTGEELLVAIKSSELST